MFVIVYGADFYRMSAGCLAKTDQNQFLTVLGYREVKKKKSGSEEEDDDDDNLGIKLNPTFVSKESVLCGLYYNPLNKEQQEIVEIAPHSAQPVMSFEKEHVEKMCEVAILRQNAVLVKLINELINEKTNLQCQAQILKSISAMLVNVQGDYMKLLIQTNMLPQLLNYLLKTSVATDPKNKAVIPLAWLEARITNIRVDALENCRSLQPASKIRVKVLKQKQLIITYKDQESGSMIAQNATLRSSINLHLCDGTSSYILNLEKDPIKTKAACGQSK